jgi:hypothetical protein
MPSFTIWLNATLFGFVYFAAALFLILWIADVKNLSLPEGWQHVAPYASVFILFASYVVGVTTHYVSAHIWQHCFSEDGPVRAADLLKMQHQASSSDLERVGGSLDTLVLFRHLFFAFCLLSITLSIWLRKHMKRVRLAAAIGCLGAATIFLLAWRFQRILYLDFLAEVKSHLTPK